MENYKLSKESRRFYERELRQYWENKKRLYNVLTKKEVSRKNDYTSSRTIIYLQERINNIETVINGLNSFEKEVFELIFKENGDWLYCKTKKNISKYTYYNTLNKCIKLLAEEFGEI